MKNWKKLLACLLVGLMALTVFTAYAGIAGADRVHRLRCQRRRTHGP